MMPVEFFATMSKIGIFASIGLHVPVRHSSLAKLPGSRNAIAPCKLSVKTGPHLTYISVFSTVFGS